MARWADAARKVALEVASDPVLCGPESLRHGRTWFVGVDALPNASAGAVAAGPLEGPWQKYAPASPLHPAQLSLIYQGYPRQNPNESAANHRFRRDRAGDAEEWLAAP